MSPAPIALFVYNRPWHMQQTIEALQQNELACESELFIFSDAPKKPEVVASVQEVRTYIRGVTGFKSIKIIERAENLGLANSIIAGVGEICNEFGRVIVLEDDLVTSPYFLRYMNDALNIYEHEERVISIHGYMYPATNELPETHFLRGADCWGWATWKRGWNIFEKDGRKLLEGLKSQQLIQDFNFDGNYDYLGMLESQIKGKNDSWAIRWYASAFLNNKLTLYPGRSLVLNIGTDSSGTHCGTTNIFSGKMADRAIKVGGIPIVENLEARAAVTRFYAANKASMLQRVLRRTKKVVSICLRWNKSD